jgi:hypothetical protein
VGFTGECDECKAKQWYYVVGTVARGDPGPKTAGPGARGWQFFNLNFMLQLASYRVVFRASNFNTASALGLAHTPPP